MKRLNELYKIDSDIEIKGVSVNSNDVNEGDIFVCIKGSKVDRHDFVKDAVKNGAVAIVAKRMIDEGVPCVVVDNPNDEVIPLSRKVDG